MQFAFIFDILSQQRKPPLPLDSFTYNEFIWAVSVVMSRQNQIPIHGKRELALIPAWDLCNHETGKITTFFDVELNALQCYAQRAFSQGDQIYIHYGNRPNSELFLYMGFVVADNPADSYRLKFPFPSATLDEVLLGKYQIEPKDIEVTIHSTIQDASELDPETLSLLRLKCFCSTSNINNKDSNTLEEVLDKVRKRELISKSNETLVFQFLVTSCLEKLKQYPPPSEDIKTSLAAQLCQIEQRVLKTAIKVFLKRQTELRDDRKN